MASNKHVDSRDKGKRGISEILVRAIYRNSHRGAL